MIDKVSQLSHRIFNTSVTENRVARESNPFSQSNFQKNILTEDVFESSTAKDKLNLSDKITASSKRIYSTFVGSLSNIGNRFQEGIENIAAFCNRMKDGVVNTWNKISELGHMEINLEGAKEVLSKDIMSFFNMGHERQIAKMAKMDPHSEVKPMLIESLSALESDIATVAVA